ncbi:MAG: winged helix-turn-helix domain-containing protein [Bryobacteraceae bacterium]|nr:winged helix-turn-helix domain-containing protein [Bryobacteraceae bacterium]
MAVPDFQSFFVPVLRSTADGNDHSTPELRDRIAADLKLTPEDLSQKLPGGVQTVFANRIAWSAVYLTKAGALERIKRGVFRITGRGKELLALNVPKLTVKDLSQHQEFVAFHKGSQDCADEVEDIKAEKTQTPEEQLANAYKVLRDSLANDILETVKKASPTFFDELVTDLLVAIRIRRRRRHRRDHQGRQTRAGRRLRSGETLVELGGAASCPGVRRESGRRPGQKGRADHHIVVFPGRSRLTTTLARTWSRRTRSSGWTRTTSKGHEVSLKTVRNSQL